MDAPLSQQQMEYLQSIDSPTVANAIETFDLRSRAEGFMSADIHGLFPELGPVVGYAATAVISAKGPGGAAAPRSELWEHVLSIPEPRVVVLQDLDDPALGAFWGEVQSNIFRALGCVGTVTNGSVRDLAEARALGFKFFAKAVSVSHAYVHVVSVGGTVTVGGLAVSPGDILHGDQHGVTNVPLEAARDLKRGADSVLEREQKIIELCQSPGFTVAKLKELAG